MLYGYETRTLLTHSQKKKKKRIQAFETKCMRTFLRISFLGAQDQRMGAEEAQLPCGSTGIFSGKRQETETCTIQACHTPRQPPRNHPSEHLGEWATSRSAEEMLDGQHQRVDITAHARTAHKDLLQQRLEEDLC